MDASIYYVKYMYFYVSYHICACQLSYLDRNLTISVVVVVVALLFYVHGKHLRSCRDGQLT